MRPELVRENRKKAFERDMATQTADIYLQRLCQISQHPTHARNCIHSGYYMFTKLPAFRNARLARYGYELDNAPGKNDLDDSDDNLRERDLKANLFSRLSFPAMA